MSYRSFKRVLGETSLERKCRFLFGACLLLLITGSFWWYGKQTEGLVYKQNPGKGRLIVDTVLTLPPTGKSWRRAKLSRKSSRCSAKISNSKTTTIASSASPPRRPSKNPRMLSRSA